MLRISKKLLSSSMNEIVASKIILFETMFQETTVRTNCGDTDWFKIGKGFRQGCIMSPNLYNIHAEDIMREVLQNYEGGVKIGSVRYSKSRSQMIQH